MNLDVKKLCTGYGKRQIIYDLSLNVADGEIVAIIGPNGSGKSTLLKAIFGLIPIWSGTVNIGSILQMNERPDLRVKQGVTFALQGHPVFNRLTVLQNLLLAARQIKKEKLNERIEDILKIFPDLDERRNVAAGKLSGGEMQMLNIARAIILAPELLLIDEPTLGLSPSYVRKVFDVISRLNSELHVSILVVDQRVMDLSVIATRFYGLKAGRLIFEAKPPDLADTSLLKDLYLT